MFTGKTNYGEVTCWNNDQSFKSRIAQGEVYEQQLVEAKLKDIITSSNTILDIGAHIGSHSLMYSKLNPNAKIYAFEPQSKIFELLKRNIETNNCFNVVLNNVAVGHKMGKISMSNTCIDGHTINVPIEYGGNKAFNLGGLQVGRGGEEVDMITIDSLQLNGCDFIKIDVEGAEPLVISGAVETIKKYKPQIFFEKNHKMLDKETLKWLETPNDLCMDTINLLKSIGYSNFTRLDSCNYLCWL